jgi:hypothetical protein
MHPLSEFMKRPTFAHTAQLFGTVFLMVPFALLATAQDTTSPVVTTTAPAATVSVTPDATAPLPSTDTVTAPNAPAASAESPSTSGASDTASTKVVEEQPWEYLPYRVRVWIASTDDRVSAERLSVPLQQFLDRSFASVWRMSIAQAPGPIQAAATRDFESMSYESITSVDPVLAIKRDHPEAPRLRFASDISKYIKKCVTTHDRLAEIKRRGAAIGNPTLDGALDVITPVDGDAIAVSELWKDQSTEAVVLSRGMAADLSKPEAKIIRLPIENLVAEEVQAHDKIFVVRINSLDLPIEVEVVELDCLMRQFSPVIRTESLNFDSVATVIGESIVRAFAPVVRIEDAGQKTAVGITRASGLVIPSEFKDKHPALISEGEFLQPMVRKDDRNGNPIAIGPIPWAFLHVKKIENSRLNMDLYSGRSGGLQGRKNARTFRMALRTRPVGPSSTIRLHAAGSPADALAGYEVYEKKLDSIDMKLVGRTDWDGRIVVNKADAPMRLLYVKNGGAVLARLPIVPGLTELEVADLMGDDQRLRAEAYIRGTQNAIVDLIAIRALLAARIRLRLEKGQLAEAKELLEALKKEPTYDTIANEMGKKVVQIKGRTSVEQRKIDELFAQTREMLVKNINSKLIRDLEADVAAAEANGGKLTKPTDAPEGDAASTTPAAPAPATTEAAAPPAPDAASTQPASPAPETPAPAPDAAPAPEAQPAPVPQPAP